MDIKDILAMRNGQEKYNELFEYMVKMCGNFNNIEIEEGMDFLPNYRQKLKTAKRAFKIADFAFKKRVPVIAE